VKISRPVLLGGVLVIVALALVYLLLADRDPTDTVLAPQATESGPADSAGTGGTTPSSGQATRPADGKDGTGETSTAATGTGTTAAPTPPAGTDDDTSTERSGGSGESSTAATGAGTSATTAAPAGTADDAPAVGSGGTGQTSTAAADTGTATPPATDSGESRTPAAGAAQGHDADTAPAGAATGTGTTNDTPAAATPDTGGQDTQVAAPDSSVPVPADSARRDAARGDDASSPVAIPVFRQPPDVPIPKLSPGSSTRPARSGAGPGSAVPAGSATGPTASADTGTAAGSTDRSGTRADAGQTAAAPAPRDAAPTVPDTTAPAAPADRKSEPATAANRGNTRADSGQTAAAPAPRDAAPTVPVATAPAAPADRKGEPATAADRGGTRADGGQTAEAPAEDAGQTVAVSPPAAAAAAASADPRDQETRIDIVRVDPQGNAVIAGRARPRSQIEVGDGTGLVGSTRANDAGEWVVVTEPMEPGDTVLTLRETGEDGSVRESRDAIVIGIAPPAADGTATAPLVAVVPRAGDPALTRPTRVIQTPQPAKPDAASDHIPQVAEGNGSADGTPSVTIDTVDYDEDGNVVLGGRADPEATVQVYVDNKLSGTDTASDTGEWVHRSPQPISPGTHELRVDQVTTSGAVIHRVVLPFVRAEPFRSLPGQRVVIIQPGNNLWTIAYRVYGTGTRYTTIYQANADQIRDPDLIYPGQVFGLPKVEL